MVTDGVTWCNLSDHLGLVSWFLATFSTHGYRPAAPSAVPYKRRVHAGGLQDATGGEMTFKINK